jgi:hypothetical protein
MCFRPPDLVANVIYYCGQSVSNIFGLDYVGVVDREVQLFPGLQAAVAAGTRKRNLTIGASLSPLFSLDVDVST